MDMIPKSSHQFPMSNNLQNKYPVCIDLSYIYDQNKWQQSIIQGLAVE